MKKLLSGLLMGFSILACANNDVVINVSSKDPSFIVSLAANPTTGYQWSVVKFDKNLLTLSNSIYEKPKTNLIGAGGKMLFIFNLNKGKTYPAQTKMVFKYARSWEPESGTIKNVTINFANPSD
ncbi:TPA: protease inhibitor I42 family protein [Legionella pneumophila]|nr:protease inhibitor I42 family protein [Legionella pneumophila subsp. fraseri]HAT1797296.1 protease inhibitor I42 family protein [Legionella pneumophila]MDW8962094.1 protease inhibitor I42 family protein [Legionella pneumophila subsp. fraseri]MDW9034912.1 protease inhibitor I42 family protein [Legionella pneumophila subsp. fraseri]MDW9037412.1 protease inhibitor I42 family protein [Legionella pneumophila subsp. fraseri]